jgi:hypothetical protein
MDLEDGSVGGGGSVEGERLSDSLLKDESVVLFESVGPREHGVEKSVTVEEGSSLVPAVVEKTLTECEGVEEARLLINGSSGEDRDSLEALEQSRCQESTEFGNMTQKSSEAGLSMATDSDISEPPAAGDAVFEPSAVNNIAAANSNLIETPSSEIIVKAGVTVLEPSACDDIAAANSVAIETPSSELFFKASVAILEPSAADNSSSHDDCVVRETPLVEISLPSTADNSGATGSVMVETPLATDGSVTAGDSILGPLSADVPLTVGNSGLEMLATTAGVTGAGEISEAPSAEVDVTSDRRDVKPAVLEEVYLFEFTDQMSEQPSSSSRYR